MQITLYNCNDDNRVVNKSLQGVTTASNCNTLSPVSVENPKIIITTGMNALNANYCYIDTFDRYYYITNVTIDSAGRTILDCTVDVLYTYRDQIKNLVGTVDRQQTMNNAYLIDDKFKSVNYRQIVAKQFPVGLTNDSIILMTLG